MFAKYGLTDKAIERLRSLVRRRPDLLQARERLVELLAESQNPALAREAEELAAYVSEPGGSDADARSRGARTRAGLGIAAGRASPPVGAAGAAPPAPRAGRRRSRSTSSTSSRRIPARRRRRELRRGLRRSRLRSRSRATRSVAAVAGAHRPTAALHPDSRADRSSASRRRHRVRLVRGARDRSSRTRCTKAGRERRGAGRRSPRPVVDEQNLFADEQQFFNLAEELEKELADEARRPDAPAIAGPQGEASLEEIFREFKKGVEQQLSAEDYETHFNLGIAYKEMGLIDEAIGEFQLASKDPARAVECCSMLGLCFLEKGMPQLAIKWYRKGLEAPDDQEVETVGLLYDLGCVYQDTGDIGLGLPDLPRGLRPEHELSRHRPPRQGARGGRTRVRRRVTDPVPAHPIRSDARSCSVARPLGRAAARGGRWFGRPSTASRSTLAAGESVALVGESGCGKTLLGARS